MNKLLSLLSLFSIVALSQAATNNILCYFESWAQYQPGNGKFGPKDVPANKCTHVVYSFILPAAGGNIQQFNDESTLRALVQLKQQNPKLKVMAAIGGWNAGSEVFSNIVGDNGQRANLVQQLFNFMNQHQLDGIDIDWEYPAQRGGRPADNENFIKFLRDLRNKFGNKIITAAVGADPGLLWKTYIVNDMSKYLDFINLMTYDFHSAFDGVTGQNSPLFPSSVDSNKCLNTDCVINQWIKNGVPSSKILMGLGFYGKSFNLHNPGSHGVGAPAGAGKPGPYTQASGLLSYLEICEKLKQGGWSTVYDTQQQAVYSFKGNEWVGYDNVNSIQGKAAYAIQHNLGGVMMWAVDNDDLRNSCGQGAMPLLNAINSVIHI